MTLTTTARSAWARTAVLALLCGTALTVVGGPAVAAPNATISGRVTTSGGAGIDGVLVRVRHPNYAVAGMDYTDLTGAYSVPGLEPGNYLVETDTTPVGDAYAREYYPDALTITDAVAVPVAGLATAVVDFQLDLAAQLCAQVQDGFGAVALGAGMSAERVDGRLGTGFWVDGEGRACYRGMPPGQWRLMFHGAGYVTEYYDDAATSAGATIVSAAPGQVIALSVTLAWTSGIDGTVTGPGGEPVAGVVVVARAGGDTASAVTAADGTYRLPLPAGAYEVSFTPDDESLEMEWYDDAMTASAADPVTVVANQYTSGVDAQLSGQLVFSDVQPGSVFYDDISWLVDERITLGYPDGTFRRSLPVTREAMAAFLHRMAGGGPSAVPGAPPSFGDVTTGNPFHDDVAWLAQEGITTGWPDGTFRPSLSVERQAMAAFLYRFAGEPEFTAPSVSPFVDVRPGDPFYREICWLAAEGVSTGTATPSGAYFKPSAPVERQAMAAFLHRLWTNVLL